MLRINCCLHRRSSNLASSYPYQTAVAALGCGYSICLRNYTLIYTVTVQWHCCQQPEPTTTLLDLQIRTTWENGYNGSIFKPLVHKKTRRIERSFLRAAIALSCKTWSLCSSHRKYSSLYYKNQFENTKWYLERTAWT